MCTKNVIKEAKNEFANVSQSQTVHDVEMHWIFYEKKFWAQQSSKKVMLTVF